jgi:hypothetical protein
MAAGTKAARGKGKGKRKGAAKPAAAKKASGNGGQKRAANKEQQEKLIQKVVSMRDKEKSWKEIAETINTTPGKAQYLMMLHQVAEGEVPRITGKTEAVLAKNLQKAREKADEHSSWGWLSARAGLPETKIKAIAEEAGFYAKGKENIAQKRAGTEGGAKKKSGKGKKRGR